MIPFIVVIPARFQSTRLPGKPLLEVAGQSMIERVYRCAQKSQAERIIVATDDQRIAETVTGFGGDVVMTSPNHASGTDRIHEVATQLQLADDAIVVNVQGDEPLIPASVIDQVAENIGLHPKVAAATLSEPIQSSNELNNPNSVKVVVDHQGYALYFSRAPIPFDRNGEGINQILLPQRHIGLYAYRVSLLNQFVVWPQAALEQVEKLEQLRILANGQSIHVGQAVASVPAGIDTPEDLQRIREQLSL